MHTHNIKLGFKRALLIAMAAAGVAGASAQNTRVGYFLDNYTYRFQMNPAFANDKSFVAMPGIGNLNVGVSGNLGVDDVLYNVDGKTTTFLNPSLSAAEVLKNINDMNRFDVDLRVNILSTGFKGFGGYNTISLSARSGVGLKIPGAAFSLLKEGIANKNYQIANLKAYANAYAELALGHSRDITPEFRVGAAVKFLVGGANANVDLRKADLTLGENEWYVTTDGDINVNMKDFRYDTDINDDTHHSYVSGADVDGGGVGGFGVAFDFGGVYKPKFLPDFEFSLAVLDFGFINWSNNMLATTGGEKSFTTDKYTFNVDDDAPNSFDNEWDRMKDDLSALYELEDAGDQGSQMRMLGTTVNAGVQYTLPYYRGLRLGLLNTTRIQGEFSWTDFRLSANIVPCRVFDAAVSVNAGTFGAGFGWIANLHCPGFNLFVGMDRMVSKMAKQGVPLNSNAQVNFGLNFLF